MESENRDGSRVEGWEARVGKRLLELLAVESPSQVLLGLPDADDVQSPLVKGAMMPELAGWPAALHDESMRIVVGPLQLLDVAIEACDQHDLHDASPYW